MQNRLLSELPENPSNANSTEPQTRRSSTSSSSGFDLVADDLKKNTFQKEEDETTTQSQHQSGGWFNIFGAKQQQPRFTVEELAEQGELSKHSKNGTLLEVLSESDLAPGVQTSRAADQLGKKHKIDTNKEHDDITSLSSRAHENHLGRLHIITQLAKGAQNMPDTVPGELITTKKCIEESDQSTKEKSHSLLEKALQKREESRKTRREIVEANKKAGQAEPGTVSPSQSFDDFVINEIMMLHHDKKS